MQFTHRHSRHGEFAIFKHLIVDESVFVDSHDLFDRNWIDDCFVTHIQVRKTIEHITYGHAKIFTQRVHLTPNKVFRKWEPLTMLSSSSFLTTTPRWPFRLRHSLSSTCSRSNLLSLSTLTPLRWRWATNNLCKQRKPMLFFKAVISLHWNSDCITLKMNNWLKLKTKSMNHLMIHVHTSKRPNYYSMKGCGSNTLNLEKSQWKKFQKKNTTTSHG